MKFTTCSILLSFLTFFNTMACAGITINIKDHKESFDQAGETVSFLKDIGVEHCQGKFDDEDLIEQIKLIADDDPYRFETDEETVCFAVNHGDGTMYYGPYTSPPDGACTINLYGNIKTPIASSSCFEKNNKLNKVSSVDFGSNWHENDFAVYTRPINSMDCSGSVGNLIARISFSAAAKAFSFSLPEGEEFCVRESEQIHDRVYGPFQSTNRALENGQAYQAGCEITLLDPDGNVGIDKEDCKAEDYVFFKNIGEKNYDVILKDAPDADHCTAMDTLPELARLKVQDGTSRHAKIIDGTGGYIPVFCVAVENGADRQWHGPYATTKNCTLTITTHDRVSVTEGCSVVMVDPVITPLYFTNNEPTHRYEVELYERGSSEACIINGDIGDKIESFDLGPGATVPVYINKSQFFCMAVTRSDDGDRYEYGVYGADNLSSCEIGILDNVADPSLGCIPTPETMYFANTSATEGNKDYEIQLYDNTEGYCTTDHRFDYFKVKLDESAVPKGIIGSFCVVAQHGGEKNTYGPFNKEAGCTINVYSSARVELGAGCNTSDRVNIEVQNWDMKKSVDIQMYEKGTSWDCEKGIDVDLLIVNSNLPKADEVDGSPHSNSKDLQMTPAISGTGEITDQFCVRVNSDIPHEPGPYYKNEGCVILYENEGITATPECVFATES